MREYYTYANYSLLISTFISHRLPTSHVVEACMVPIKGIHPFEKHADNVILKTILHVHASPEGTLQIISIAQVKEILTVNLLDFLIVKGTTMNYLLN